MRRDTVRYLSIARVGAFSTDVPPLPWRFANSDSNYTITQVDFLSNWRWMR